MNKKVIGVIIAAIVILVAIAGVVYMTKGDDKNKTGAHNSESKTLGTNIEDEENKQTASNENKQNEQETATENKAEDNTNKNNEKTGKILIAYFSRADENYNVGTVDVGNTEIMAGFIKDYLKDKADTFKIDPIKAYPTNYKECTEVATQELNSNARPEFKMQIA